MRLLEALRIGGAGVAPSRVMFGPHVTNLGIDGAGRRYSDRHAAYYARRARGGAGVIVVEEASVHPSDWPYERSPLAELAGEGWAAIVAAVAAASEPGTTGRRRPTPGPQQASNRSPASTSDPAASRALAGGRDGVATTTGTRPLVIAALGHAGGQGSSAYSQQALWAPSRVPEVNTREVPKWMEADDIAAVVDGFGSAAKVALEAGCDGVEVNAGQHSLVRQFLSGLTNQRGDEWGQDRTRFAREVLAAVRSAIGPERVLGLRLSGDELAPWAGITPEQAPELAAALVSAVAPAVDYLVVVRGSIFSVEQTRPDLHQPEGINVELTRAVRAAVRAASPSTAVVLQGSVVDPGQAEWAIQEGVADLVEMTRAQLADPDLVAKLRDGHPARVRPCLRCNQTCQVRDARNPIVTCVVEPTTGHETEDPDWLRPAAHARHVLVVGAGVAGLEAARIAAERGHHVTVAEATAAPGGTAAVAGPGGPLVAWLVAECERLGVTVETGRHLEDHDLASAHHAGTVVVVATGSRPGRPTYEIEPGAATLDVRAVRDGSATIPPDGSIVLHDPIGGPIAVALAEELGERAVLVTPDNIAGNELSRSGDLAPANVRLQQRGVRIERRSILRSVSSDHVVVEDRFTGERRRIEAAGVVDCGFRLPEDRLVTSAAHPVLVAGDAVAPRTYLEAVVEGRRAALAVDAHR